MNYAQVFLQLGEGTMCEVVCTAPTGPLNPDDTDTWALVML